MKAVVVGVVEAARTRDAQQTDIRRKRTAAAKEIGRWTHHDKRSALREQRIMASQMEEQFGKMKRNVELCG
ncbi:MAG TPA: hypothetical protein VFB43_10350 [Terracidiphilus sp.]|nr:hypothetical protein [Terracidiphilus sp.]